MQFNIYQPTIQSNVPFSHYPNIKSQENDKIGKLQLYK